ncbi:rhodanese-like domain-containing protein [Membranicola marinus]|uniref:Rhodanese-like domain-containing protein n=1 Tax=Membranihabitans marinus TaxID=1227546 RepID=A0A953HSB9_9BACT|nr:rhodanese-like domain-containing protein [Membranihabitans marinus]MBY5957003.1 rhodanese-like domain-containing protein [Membranihabitans marinus]
MFDFLKKLFSQTDNSQLIEAINNKPFLVDVRTPGEYSSGSVNEAVNIPLDKLPDQINKFRNKRNVIVFCRSGARSSRAKRILNQNGINNVINGGSWQNVNEMINQRKTGG